MPAEDETEAVIDATLRAWASAGRQSRVPVEGASMWPLLQPGDVALIAHGRQPLHNGDILAYRAGGRVVVHRLLRRGPGGEMLTGGDNVPRVDAPVSGEMVLGHVVVVETGGRQVRLDTRRAWMLGRIAVALRWARGHPTAWRAARRLLRLGARWARR